MQVIGNNAIPEGFQEIYDIDISSVFPNSIETFNPDLINEAMYHLKMLHSKNQGHIIFIKDDMKTTYFSTYESLTETKLKSLFEKGFTHITQSTFVGTSRRSEYAFSNTVFMLDLDFHKDERYKHLTPAQMLLNIDFDGLEPTYALTSGNGINLNFVLKNNLALYNQPNNAKLRKAIYVALVKKFEKYGADKSTSDITRFNKMPGALNYKNGSQVKILSYQNEKTYSLDELVEHLGIVKKSKSTKKKSTHKSNVKYIFNPYSLKIARFKDIQKLIELRNYNITNRETTLFIMANFHLQAFKDKESTLEYIENINNWLKNPLSTSEITSMVKRLNPRYNYFNKTLIETLEITQEEQKHMNTLIGTQEKYDRKNEARRTETKKVKRRLAPEDNKQIQKKTKSMNTVIEYKNLGYKNKQIAELMNVDLSYVYKILKKIKEV